MDRSQGSRSLIDQRKEGRGRLGMGANFTLPVFRGDLSPAAGGLCPGRGGVCGGRRKTAPAFAFAAIAASAAVSARIIT